MISLEDCIALCGLTRDEIAAIAEHEHMPEIAAAALAQYKLCHAHGARDIRVMIVEDIRAALRDGNTQHAATLFAALRHFLLTHDEARTGP